MKVKFAILTLLTVILSPALAFAHPVQSSIPQGPSTRVRPTLFHDRSPHQHEHASLPHH